MSLYPTFSTPEIEGYSASATPQYKVGLYFDWKTGDLKIDGRGKIIQAGEKDAWLQWCRKSIQTQYGAFLAYSNAYGADLQYIFSQEDRKSCESAIEQEVKNAVMNDPAMRTLDASDFEYEWEGDSVHVTFLLLGADGYTEKTSLELKG